MACGDKSPKKVLSNRPARKNFEISQFDYAAYNTSEYLSFVSIRSYLFEKEILYFKLLDDGRVRIGQKTAADFAGFRAPPFNAMRSLD
jgi:hypothetical protein